MRRSERASEYGTMLRGSRAVYGRSDRSEQAESVSVVSGRYLLCAHTYCKCSSLLAPRHVRRSHHEDPTSTQSTHPTRSNRSIGLGTAHKPKARGRRSSKPAHGKSPSAAPADAPATLIRPCRWSPHPRSLRRRISHQHCRSSQPSSSSSSHRPPSASRGSA